MTTIFSGEGIGESVEKALDKKLLESIGKERFDRMANFLESVDDLGIVMLDLGENGDSFRSYFYKRHPNFDSYDRVKGSYFMISTVEELLNECNYDTTKTKKRIAEDLLDF